MSRIVAVKPFDPQLPNARAWELDMGPDDDAVSVQYDDFGSGAEWMVCHPAWPEAIGAKDKSHAFRCAVALAVALKEMRGTSRIREVANKLSAKGTRANVRRTRRAK